VEKDQTFKVPENSALRTLLRFRGRKEQEQNETPTLSLVICPLYNTLWGEHIKYDRMGGAYSMLARDYNLYRILFGRREKINWET
jgi:hypothetical protein